MNRPDPARILEVGLGFWPSKALLSAVELRLFSVLGEGGKTAEQIRQALGLHARAVPDFPDTLVALRFLERDGEGAAAVYRNTPESAAFLDASKPSYLGGFLEMANARLYRFWGGLTEALRTGKPQNEIKHTGAPMFEQLYREPERLEQFMGAMRGLSVPNFEALARKFDFSKYRTLADIGGAMGDLCIAVAAAHPHLECTSYDLPPVQPIATRAIAAAGLSDRIATGVVDFFAEPLPKADVITMGMILHDWNLERKLHLIRAAYEALPEGGAFVVIEALIDDERRTNAFGLMMSLNMIVEFGDAFDYTGRDFEGWCKQVGFARCEVIPLQGPSSAGVAYK